MLTNRNKLNRTIAVCFLVACTSACVTLPEDAFRLSESAVELRQIQTRVYTDISDVEILAASSGVLQDLGYAIDELEKELGVLSASKRADASSEAEIVGNIAMDIADCVLTFLLGCENHSYKGSKDVQDIKITFVVLPESGKDNTFSVRLTMQRFVWAKSGDLYDQETISDANVYQAFFEKLSKSVFLEKEGV